MTAFRPLRDHVLIKVLDSEAQSKGGIFIPEKAREKPCEAQVVAVGPGKFVKSKFLPTTVRPGDTVVYARNAGTPVQIDGVEHIVLHEEELFGVLRKKGASQAICYCGATAPEECDARVEKEAAWLSGEKIEL